MNETHWITRIMLLMALVFGGRAIYRIVYNPDIHRGNGYTVIAPEGWSKQQVDKETVLFVAPERDYIREMNVAMISIYSKKFTEHAIFLEDVWEEVQKSLAQEGVRVLDKGEIKISEIIANWILFLKDDPELLVLTFYMMDDANRLFRIQYATRPDRFPTYRDVFEKMKDGMTFTKIF